MHYFGGQPTSQAPSPQLCDNAGPHRAFLSKSSPSRPQSVTLCEWAGGYNGDQPTECQASYIVQEYGASVREKLLSL